MRSPILNEFAANCNRKSDNSELSNTSAQSQCPIGKDNLAMTNGSGIADNDADRGGGDNGSENSGQTEEIAEHLAFEHSQKNQLKEIRRTLDVLVNKDGLVELRALEVDAEGVPGLSTISGFFRDRQELAQQALELSEYAKGVYITLNPIRYDETKGKLNDIQFARSNSLSKDEDILSRRWLLVDADPVRPGVVSSMEEEKAKAGDKIQEVKSYLFGRGWPEPVVCDSGNGFHLLYRVDLPAQDEGLVKRVLEVLDDQFSTNEVKIDKAVYNPARITKLYGTKVRKGNDEPDRPHRWSALIEVPTDITAVPKSLLEKLVARAKTSAGSQPSMSRRNRVRVPPSDSVLKRAQSYISKMGPAISGQNGHNQTFKVACSLILGFDLSIEEALPLFREWNNKLSEKWTEWELRHKLEDAEKQGGERGYLLGPENKAFDKEENEGREAADDPHRLARAFLQESYGSSKEPTLRFWRQDWYRWDGAAYIQVPAGEMRAELGKGIKREFDRLYPGQFAAWTKREGENSDKQPPKVMKVTRFVLDNVLQALASLTIVPGSQEQPFWLNEPVGRPPAKEMVAAKNTLIHLPAFIDGKKSLLPLTHDFFTGTALDYPIDVTAKPPQKWLAFLSQLWENDPESIETLREWFGYCLLPNTSQQKILFVIGPRRSGKGTIARVLRALLGDKNVAGLTLSSLATNFGLSPLIGKNLAIVPDARLSARADQGVIVERLLSISGEDSLTIDRKNREPITVQLPTRLMILTNELPRLIDASTALTSRLINLQLKRSFYGQEDHDLINTLLEELPGIFLWAVEGLKQLRARGRFKQPATGQDIANRLIEISSPVTAFANQVCDLGASLRVNKQLLFFQWRKWCEKNGHEHGSIGTLGRNLIAAFPDVDSSRPRVDGTRLNEYVGITIKPHREIYDSSF